MTRNREHFEEFAPHTLLKHAVYGGYLERWSRILLSRFDVVRVVDACAGEGGDEAGNPGSPLIALQKGRAAVSQLSGSSGAPKRVDLVAIEKTNSKVRALQERIGSTPNTRVIHGTLSDVIDELVRDGGKVPHLYFIDPFGVSPLKADVIRRALLGPRNEVFLLFAGPAIRRHFGAYEGVFAPDDESPQGNLFSELLPVAAPPPPTPAQQTAATSSERILDDAFGTADWRSLLSLPVNQRLVAAVELFCEVMVGLGAHRVLPMPILDQDFRLKYHLIYGTKSPTGFTVMKEEISRALNKQQMGSEGGVQLGMSGKISAVANSVRQHFRRASEASWADVRAFVMEETRFMPWQAERLREQLQSSVVGGRKNAPVYRFLDSPMQ